jgi:hypothetical protein
VRGPLCKTYENDPAWQEVYQLLMSIPGYLDLTSEYWKKTVYFRDTEALTMVLIEAGCGAEEYEDIMRGLDVFEARS